ncbi:MAG: hypothetical protein AAFQ43_04620 [Bacteroidota bacterium]
MLRRLSLLSVFVLSMGLGGCAVAGEVLGGSDGGPQAREATVPVCHRGRTIRVPGSEVRAHLNHGDHRGACRR